MGKGGVGDIFKDVKRIRIVELEDLALTPYVHISVFRKDGADIDTWRVFWSNTNFGKYSIFMNYWELSEKHPETMKLLVNLDSESAMCFCKGLKAA